MDKKEKLSITSENRIQNLIEEATQELSNLLPVIRELEGSIAQLQELRNKKHKLESLIINLKSILPKETNVETCADDVIKNNANFPSNSRSINVNKISSDSIKGRNVFIPDVALSHAKNYLRTKNNVNYEIYKAVVFNTGEATTDEIKYYLIKNNIKQPKTGNDFKDVPLKEISSRTNYLVRKNLLISYTPGVFATVFGWEEVE